MNKYKQNPPWLILPAIYANLMVIAGLLNLISPRLEYIHNRGWITFIAGLIVNMFTMTYLLASHYDRKM